MLFTFGALFPPVINQLVKEKNDVCSAAQKRDKGDHQLLLEADHVFWGKKNQITQFSAGFVFGNTEAIFYLV